MILTFYFPPAGRDPPTRECSGSSPYTPGRNAQDLLPRRVKKTYKVVYCSMLYWKAQPLLWCFVVSVHLAVDYEPFCLPLYTQRIYLPRGPCVVAAQFLDELFILIIISAVCCSCNYLSTFLLFITHAPKISSHCTDRDI